MAYILLGVVLACGAARTVFGKKLGLISDSNEKLFLYNGIAFAVVLVMVFTAYCIGRTAISAFTALWAVAYAVLAVAAQLFYILALKNGATGICTFFYSAGFIIPTFAGVLFWNEPFVYSQLTGVLLVLGSFALIGIFSKRGKTEQNETDGENKKRGGLWIIPAVLSMLASGVIGVVQKIHQTSAYKGELFAFLFISFIFATAFSLTVSVIMAKKRKTVFRSMLTKPAVLSSICNGVTSGGVNILNLYLAGALPSMVFFPIYNGGVIIAGLILGIIVYKEKITKYDMIGLAAGVAGILLIALKPF